MNPIQLEHFYVDQAGVIHHSKNGEIGRSILTEEDMNQIKELFDKEMHEYFVEKEKKEAELRFQRAAIDAKIARLEEPKTFKESIVLEMRDRFSIPSVVKDFIKKQPIYYDINKIWWAWNQDKHIWSMIDETEIMVALNEAFNITGLHKSQIQTEILNELRIRGRMNKPKDPQISWIHFGTKVIDISTYKEFEATPEYFFTNTLPYTPGAIEDTPILDKLFKEWVGPEYVDTLYQIIAYCCYRDYPIHHLFCFVGAGSNGKSTYLNIINKFIGTENSTSISLDTLMNSRFESASLYRKLVCQMGETNFGTISRTEILKKLTGQDLVNFEFKQKMPFSDKNYAKILISTNTLPETTDKTEGFYRRWVIIDFPNKFNGETNILEYIPEWEFNNLSKKIMRILPKLLYERKFWNIGTVEERKTQYENKSNPLKRFIEEHTEEMHEEYISKWEFAKRYNDFLIQNNLRLRSETEIGMAMTQQGFEFKKIAQDQPDGSVKYVRCWMDIRWKDQKNPSINSESIEDSIGNEGSKTSP